MKVENNEQRLNHLWGNRKYSNIYVIGVLEIEERKRRREIWI